MAADFVCFDCETRPTSRADITERIRLDGRTYTIASNRPAAEKAAWDALGREGQLQYRLGKTAVGPYAELLCVVARHADRDGQDDEVCLWDCFQRSEADLLAELAEDWTQRTDGNTVWIAHNAAFDVPLLLRRCAVYGIAPPPAFPTSSRRDQGRVYDTMTDPPFGPHHDNGKNGLFVSLAEMARTFGVQPPADNGDDPEADDEPFAEHSISRWLRDRDFDRIVQHCQDDERATWEIFMRATHGGRLLPFPLADGDFEAWLATQENLSELERDGYRYRHYRRRGRALRIA